MIIKLIGLLLISISGGLIGIDASMKLKKRVCFLEKYIVLMNEIKTKIRFSACDIRILFRDDTGFEPIDFMTSEFNRNIRKSLSVKQAWSYAVNHTFKKYRLSKSDKSIIEEFGSTFGQNDIDGEINHINLHTTLIANRLEKARDELSQKGKLYRTLGLFGGITLSLIIL